MLTVISKKLASHDLSSVQFDFPQSLADEIIAWGKDHIKDADLYIEGKKLGREDEIHITVKYGLHTSDKIKVQNLIDGFGTFDIRLGEISRFVPKEENYDVIKIDIESRHLKKLNAILCDLPNSDSHPYKAHCTIAYVKKGKCSDLSGNSDLKDKIVHVKELTFSPSIGEKTTLSLV